MANVLRSDVETDEVEQTGELSPAKIRLLLPIRSGDLQLAPMTRDDLHEFHESATTSREALIEWMGWWEKFSIQMAGKYIAYGARMWESSQIQFETVLSFSIRESGEFAGVIELGGFNVENKLAEVSYWIDARRTQRHLARRALHLLASFCFERTGIQRLQICVSPGNEGSQSVIKHVGGYKIAVRMRMDRKNFDAEDVFRLTRAVLVNEVELDKAIKDPIKRIGHHDFSSEQTGIDGILRVWLEADGPSCVHHIQNETEFCVQVFPGHNAHSDYVNKGKEIDPGTLSKIKQWIGLNEGMIVKCESEADLWLDHEREAYLKRFVSI